MFLRFLLLFLPRDTATLNYDVYQTNYDVHTWTANLLALNHYGVLKVDRSDVIPTEIFDLAEDEVESVERSCFVLWPRSRGWAVLADENPVAMARFLLESDEPKAAREEKLKLDLP